MNLTPPQTESYIQKLKEKDRAPFRKKYEVYLEDLDHNQVETTVSRQLNHQKKHVDLVVSVASGFSPGSKPQQESRYSFHSTDPLSYLKSSGADVLLARNGQNSIHLCVFVCEIGDASVKDWINGVNTSHGVMEQSSKLDKIRAQLGFPDKKIGEVQYVLLLRPSDAKQHPHKEIVDQVEPDNFAIWSSETTEKSEICHLHGNKLHRDLQNVAQGCFDWAASGDNPIKYTVETHPIVPLQEVSYSIIRNKAIYADDPEPLELYIDDFQEQYEDYLQIGCEGDNRDELVQSAVDDILDVAEKIGFYSSNNTNTSRDYRIMYRGGADNPLKAKRECERKYLDLATKVRKQEIAFSETQKEFDSIQSGLDEWDSK